MDATPPPLVPPTPVPPVYKDRRTGLIVFGIFAIIIGAFFALMVPLAIFGQFVAARRLGTDFDGSAAFIGAAVYGLMAVVMIWLGVGSVLARRWARALLLCISWMALITGLFAMPAVYVAMDSIGDTLRAQGQTAPPAALAIAKVVGLVVTFIIYILIPGIAVLFYRSPHVRQTCEVRDPVQRWTDCCPLPVLALVVLQGFAALMILLVLPIYGRAFPIYGQVVGGWASRFLWVVMIVFMAYAARGFYRLNLQAWWIYVVGTIVLWASSLVTFQRLGLVGFYRQMGLPERQLLLMEKNPLLQGNSLLWVSLVGMTAFLGYVIYVKRYFSPPARDPQVVA